MATVAHAKPSRAMAPQAKAIYAEAVKDMDLADELLKAGKRDRALASYAEGCSKFEAVLNLVPEDVDVGVELAQCYKVSGSAGTSGYKIAGYSLLGVGGAALVGWGIVGGLMLSKEAASDADGHCNATNNCDDTGTALRLEAQQLGKVATGLLVGGGALALAGIVLVARSWKCRHTRNVVGGAFQTCPPRSSPCTLVRRGDRLSLLPPSSNPSLAAASEQVCPDDRVQSHVSYCAGNVPPR